jgi:hypothetical protein
MALAASRAKRSVDNVEVKSSEMFGGGMGLFSTRNFEEGDVILMEKPFLKIQGRDNRRGEFDSLIFLEMSERLSHPRGEEE